jgi:hypothetical protein
MTKKNAANLPTRRVKNPEMPSPQGEMPRRRFL